MPSIRALLRVALLASLCLGGLPPAAAAPKITTTGTPASAPPTLYGPGWDIGGGGTDVDAAMQWLVDYVRGGSSSSNRVDIVVLRTTGTSGYNGPWSALNGVSSVTTIVGTSRADFDDSRAAALVRNAGVVFFAGGNQGDYVNYIKGSACDTAARYVVGHGGGMGGTSAGTAIQGPIVFDSIAANAAGGANVASADAMADPYESTISFTRDWYAWPHFQNILCEPHFGDPGDDASNKDRMGRLMAFLARQVKDGITAAAWGMAVNAGTSVVVDRNGLARVMGTGTAGDGVAYMILLDHMPEVCAPGTPLTCSGYKIWRLTAGQTFDLANRPTCSYYLGGVNAGALTGNFYVQGTLVTHCDTAPVITAQPASQTVAPGQSATFSVVASGTSLGYQWRRDGSAIPGANAANYTTPAAVASDNGAAFSVMVSNAAGSVASANAILTVTSGGGSGTDILLNGGFESGSTAWTATSGVIGNSTGNPARTGAYRALLCGYGKTHLDTLRQQVSIPSGAASATLTYWLKITTRESTTTGKYDRFYLQVTDTAGTVLATLASLSNLDATGAWVQRSADLTPWKGRTVRVLFTGQEDNFSATGFCLDDLSLVVR
jgi:cyanophycinase-like exopeptidase